MNILILMSLLLPGDTIKVRVNGEGRPLEMAHVSILDLNYQGITDSLGEVVFENIPGGKHSVEVSYVGFMTQVRNIETGLMADFDLVPLMMEEVVVTGTMREMKKSESPVPVDIISSRLFLRNPTPSIFESVGMITGVQPVLACNVCYTGSIQINGIDGAYTQVLIDGMPIVSGLATVYGLNGIPNQVIDRIEIVKGPGASLYGSEAMAGQINIITKNPDQVGRIFYDGMVTSWREWNLDMGLKLNSGRAMEGWLGINGFYYNQRFDFNQDGFTDIPVQQRLSIFNKWKGKRIELAGRYFYENRWGGQVNWTSADRGGDEVYGESIWTNRFELIGKSQPWEKLPIHIQGSFNIHHQDSYYGQTYFLAQQTIGFVQAYYDKRWKKHQILMGMAYRHQIFDDNTPISVGKIRDQIPGLFLQDEWDMKSGWMLLGGWRLDHHSEHKFINSPRIAMRKEFRNGHVWRMSAGKGFRVLQLFTEEHAALSGSREVIITERLKPEESWNFNLNYHGEKSSGRYFLDWDGSVFYTVFTNKIWPDYDMDPDKIIYSNSRGNSITRGISVQMNYSDGLPIRANMGITWMDVFQREEDGRKFIPVRVPRWSGVFGINYESKLSFDLTGNWYGPQRLAVVENDFRSEYSPWFAIINVQVTKRLQKGAIYGGVKNLLNFIPKDPILRPFDPFDREVDPMGYTFDAAYNYASMQGIRLFFGMRFSQK